ncbi:MAG: hypothetical protein QOF60_909 [Actinomycetota bacterium]|jgi:hypothetical protein|nr:hypothetical protein [Actinomycetota bacterium]
MRTWVTVAIVGSLLAIGMAALLIVNGDEQRRASPTTTTPRLRSDGLIGSYEITVTDPSGQIQQATFTCATVGKATGYLAKSMGYESCRTAISPGPTLVYLETGRRPPADCAAIQQVTHAGWQYVITGTSFNEDKGYVPVHQSLKVETACDEALWRQLQDMLADPLARS